MLKLTARIKLLKAVLIWKSVSQCAMLNLRQVCFSVKEVRESQIFS